VLYTFYFYKRDFTVITKEKSSSKWTIAYGRLTIAKTFVKPSRKSVKKAFLKNSFKKKNVANKVLCKSRPNQDNDNKFQNKNNNTTEHFTESHLITDSFYLHKLTILLKETRNSQINKYLKKSLRGLCSQNKYNLYHRGLCIISSNNPTEKLQKINYEIHKSVALNRSRADQSGFAHAKNKHKAPYSKVNKQNKKAFLKSRRLVRSFQFYFHFLIKLLRHRIPVKPSGSIDLRILLIRAGIELNPGPESSLKIISCNVRGLRSHYKRKLLFNKIHKMSRISKGNVVIFLQETHFNKN